MFVRGEIDLASAPQLDEDLQFAISASDADLIIDCKYLTFIDSSGVKVLLDIRRRLLAQQRGFRLANVGAGPARVFELLGLADLLQTARSTTMAG